MEREVDKIQIIYCISPQTRIVAKLDFFFLFDLSEQGENIIHHLPEQIKLLVSLLLLLFLYECAILAPNGWHWCVKETKRLLSKNLLNRKMVAGNGFVFPGIQ